MKQMLGLLFLVQFAIAGFCQNTIGIPEIINYSKHTYKAGTQNWDICQDSNGLIYFANNEGLLSFDGTFWKTYPLPNKTIVRSVAIGADNNIYAGGQDEIGYFSPDTSGSLVYHSLKSYIPEKYRSFSDVWDIVCIGKSVFFRSSEQILQFSNNTITVFPAPRSWSFMGSVEKRLIAQDEQNGIYTFEDNQWLPLANNHRLPADLLITALLPAGKDSIIITTLKNGLYQLTQNQLTAIASPDLKSIATYIIYSAAIIDKNRFALATSTKGCIVVDKEGRQVQQFSRFEGLQNNNILSVFTDKHKNLWLGLDSGVDFIAYDSPIKHIVPDIQNEGAGYSTIIFNNRLYIATTNGLYSTPLYETDDLSFVKGRFSLVENTRGQAWNLSEVNGKLLLGHHEGFREVRGNKAVNIDNSTGFWIFLPLNSVLSSSTVVAGSYNGLRFYDYKNGKFSKRYTDANFESARFVTVSNNIVWVSHPYKGVYRVELQDNTKAIVKKYTGNHNIKLGPIGNYIFKIRNRVVITSENGIYEYNEQSDQFEPSEFLNSIFGSTVVRYLREDGEGNLWFVYDKSLGVVDFSTNKAQIIYITELNNKLVSGFEQVYPKDSNNILVGAEKGYFHINFAKYKRNHPLLTVQLRKVTVRGSTDSILFNGYLNKVNEPQLQNNIPAVSYHWNSFHFEFSSPLYEHQSNVEYSYFLKGYDHKWSEWSTKTEREFMYLPAGKYTLELKSRNNMGSESQVFNYSFVIHPPWYQSWWAYTLYTCLFLYFLYLIYHWQNQIFIRQRQRYEERQKQLRDLHQLELEKNEKEIVKLRNEKLEAEINHKNKEVASATMHLVKKGELISRIQEELLHLTKSTEEEKSLEALKKMIKAMGDDKKMDEDWDHFTVYFDKAHNDFFLALKEKHSNLTPNELKLCGYLRMNLSTKEMAQLMNISVRGVEISRYRLRKKLQIPTETNLFTYLLSFQGNTEENRNNA